MIDGAKGMEYNNTNGLMRRFAMTREMSKLRPNVELTEKEIRFVDKEKYERTFLSLRRRSVRLEGGTRNPKQVSTQFISDDSDDRRIASNVSYTKPSFSYVELITMAIKGSPYGRSTLSEICDWIRDNFEYYRSSDMIWRNSIRHNLSLSKAFKRVPRMSSNVGKGGYWEIDKNYDLESKADGKQRSDTTVDDVNAASGDQNMLHLNSRDSSSFNNEMMQPDQ